MDPSLIDTLTALSKGEITVEQANEYVVDHLTQLTELAVEGIASQPTEIGILDGYAMAALATIDDSGDADEIAGRAFEIAEACLRERARFAVVQALDEELERDDDDDEGDEGDGGGHASH